MLEYLSNEFALLLSLLISVYYFRNVRFNFLFLSGSIFGLFVLFHFLFTHTSITITHVS